MTGTDHAGQVIRKYRRLSRYYDPLFATLETVVFYGKDKNPRHALSRKIPSGNLAVLDVCTGTGRGILPAVKPGCSITAIDLSAEMLHVAEKKIQKENIHNLSLHEMDATRMTFSDGHFDIVISSASQAELVLVSPLSSRYYRSRPWLVDCGHFAPRCMMLSGGRSSYFHGMRRMPPGSKRTTLFACAFR